MSIGNNFLYDNESSFVDYFSEIEELFVAIETQSYFVEAHLVNPEAYSITVQAIIYSDY